MNKNQQALYEVVRSIPEGRWASYADVGEALAVAGVIEPATNRGALGRAAASIEDSLRRSNLSRGILEDDTQPDLNRDGALTAHGYPWWRVRDDNGNLVRGGVGRAGREVITDPHSTGNVWLRDEGGEIVGGGFASQATRFALPALPPVDRRPALCQECFNPHTADQECY